MDLSNLVFLPASKKLATLVLILIAFMNCETEKTQQSLTNATLLGKTLNNGDQPSLINTGQNDQDQPQEIVIQHNLKAGETPQDLAAQYKADPTNILKANGIENWTDVKPGQIILIPVKRLQSE